MLIRSLMELIGSKWTWSQARYPKLDLSDRSKRRHVLLHLQKAFGLLSGEEEHVDHGQPMDRDHYREGIAKLVIGALQLAVLESVDPDLLAKDIEEILKKYNP